MEAAGSKFLKHSSTTIRPSRRGLTINQILLTLANSSRRMGPRQESKKRTKSVLFFPFCALGNLGAIHPPLHSAWIEIYRSFQFRSFLYLSKLHFNEWDALGKSLSNPTKHSNKHHSSSVINCRLKLRGLLLFLPRRRLLGCCSRMRRNRRTWSYSIYFLFIVAVRILCFVHQHDEHIPMLKSYICNKVNNGR